MLELKIRFIIWFIKKYYPESIEYDFETETYAFRWTWELDEMLNAKKRGTNNGSSLLLSFPSGFFNVPMNDLHALLMHPVIRLR